MSNQKVKKSYLFVMLPCILVAMILQIVHLPEVISINRPNLVVLVLLFFSLLPQFSFTLEAAFVIGIILDLVTGAPMGFNPLILVGQIYIITTHFENFIKYKTWQQILIVALTTFMVSVLGYWGQHIIGQSYYDPKFLIPSLATAILWPFVMSICALLCNVFNVATDEDTESVH